MKAFTLRLFFFSIIVAACSKSEVKPEPVASSAGAGGAGASGTTGAGGQEPSAGSGGAISEECPQGLPGPALVRLMMPGGHSYCMDKTEVSQGNYADFLAQKPSKEVLLEGSGCKAKATLEVEEEGDTPFGCSKGVYDPETKGNSPMQCASWCMAYAYCRWAGKRLCGVQGNAKPESEEAWIKIKDDPNESEWYNACSDGGESKYAWGDSYDESCLPDSTREVDATEEKESCNNSKGIVALGNNVSEWENLCVGDLCTLRGGSYTLRSQTMEYASAESTCSARGISYRESKTSAGIGFRCCADFK